jgi:hypothetical protein
VAPFWGKKLTASSEPGSPSTVENQVASDSSGVPLNQSSIGSEVVEGTSPTSKKMMMMAMPILGVAVSIGVIYLLASSSTEGEEAGYRGLESVYANIVDAALPQDATDVLSIVLGESIGGFIGAAATSVTTFLLRLQIKQVQQDESIVTESVAGGEYFLTRAAALPLLEALGLPPVFASLTSALLATIPYELIKLGSRRRQQMREEEEMMFDALLKEQELKKSRGFFGIGAEGSRDMKDMSTVEFTSSSFELDVPEIFSDVIKWLEFDVLQSDFGGTLGTAAGVEGAVFGSLAGLSSQMYLDFVRIYTDYGPEDKKVATKKRSIGDTVGAYLAATLSTGTLFAVYEVVREPVSVFLSGILSGGVDGCLGSSNVKACLATYIAANPAEASFEAQGRSLIIALLSLWERFNSEGAESSLEYARAAAVQLYATILTQSSFFLDSGVVDWNIPDVGLL